jgi:pilus assembly protein Flp/PilA
MTGIQDLTEPMSSRDTAAESFRPSGAVDEQCASVSIPRHCNLSVAFGRHIHPSRIADPQRQCGRFQQLAAGHAFCTPRAFISAGEGIHPTPEDKPMMQKLHQLWSDDQGQDLAEYGLLVALIALAVIGGITAFGSSMNGWFNGLFGELTSAGAGSGSE